MLKENPSALIAFRFRRSALRRRRKSTDRVIDASEIQTPTGRLLRGTHPAPVVHGNYVIRKNDFRQRTFRRTERDQQIQEYN